ncbi:glycoside hydrolase family 99-like domain-containing protein [Kaistia dalseonensis]|uniref:glycoside hydrolase family 99-like domain-containing protein n=1 Tax=Kaistia dalseonensis TaxID=410840 RepID=UPI0022587EFA|nr:glycoside hydrolase family 99-like domain-containing protein [Kaistia dalseonensis]MCX5495662.1 glycoside hydrolase family 99-like domain-containing protein [Kaistia dalseonensis]
MRDFVELSAEETPAAACDVKLIAYYLPQFHPIPENDKWWGKGFTEWRNVTRAFPVFADHYQPRVPGELGYYDLRVIDTMRRQVELAKQHGITAFCFHFYWFAGKRLLELPIESFLNNKDLDLQFALSWANENWSKRWDGGNNELLIAQNHSREDDIAFIRYIDRYFKDDRYMKVDGKPVLSVYRPAIIDHMKDTIAVWRQQALELGYPGIYLIATSSFNFKEFAEYGFDALSEFPPHSIQAEQLQDKLELASVRTGGPIYSYESLVDIVTSRPPVAPGMIHPGAIPSWDNSARRPFDGHIFHGASPALFARWLRHCFKVARGHRPEERFVFINAWNEWAEGAYLEPDQRYGYAYLAACAEVVRENSTPDPTGKRISAIVPNYNHAPFLEERLNSILGQTQSVAEIIILDDASTDDSRAVIARAIEGATIPVRVIVNEQNSGSIFGQWAKGIELAQGDLIWICESDDSCDPDFLMTLSPHLDDPSVLLAFGKVNYIDRDGNPSPDLDAYREGIRPGYWDAPHIESAQTWFDGAFGIANVIPNVGGCLFRKQRIDPQLLQELLSYKVCGDWYLYSRFAHGGRIAYEPKALAYFRRHGANTSVLSYRGDAFYEEHVALAKALRRHHRVSIETTRKMLDRVQDHYRSTFGESAASQFIERFPFRDIVSEPRTIQHIVIALYGLQTGGGEIFPIHLANELSRRGHDVSLLIATTENSNARVRRLVAPGIPIFTQDFVESIGLERFLRDYGVDLIHTHNIVSDMWLHQKLASVDIPYVVTHHGSYEAVPLDPSLVNWLLRNVDQWVYISDKNLNYTKGLRVERDRFTQLPNAMPSSTGAFAFTRAELGIEPDAFVFGLASRAVYSKGWDVAIRALVALRKETDRPVHLLLCGDGDDLVALKRNYGQVPGVHFLGYQDNIQSFYGLCDCCILPTRYVGESYPLTLVEALQAGTPVIATDIGEISKILQIQDRPLGLTFPMIEDDAAFEANVRQAMKRMLDADYYAVIASNLADGRALLSMEKLVVSYEEIYTRASGSGQPLAAEGNRRS